MPTFMMKGQEEVDLPGTLTYYRTPGLVWDSALQVGTALLVDSGRAMKRGHVSEVWNAAVTGPSFTTSRGSRTGDELAFSAGAFFADGVAGRCRTPRCPRPWTPSGRSGRRVRPRSSRCR
ncbi:hypothetical protein FHR32_006375 [Streptosporangium album]|uniref:Uncharacterized protein n=1 Tax=Streptosporangium album TaxID=47479 RepID=A0A7W7S145_9ACTN|nr:hypothetical protein [Streptosporangium album]MBB4941989.1 hypothetical protein [Streptosporangium album]